MQTWCECDCDPEAAYDDYMLEPLGLYEAGITKDVLRKLLDEPDNPPQGEKGAKQ